MTDIKQGTELFDERHFTRVFGPEASVILKGIDPTYLKVKSRGDKEVFANLLGWVVKDWSGPTGMIYLHAKHRGWTEELVKAFHHITED